MRNNFLRTERIKTSLVGTRKCQVAQLHARKNETTMVKTRGGSSRKAAPPAKAATSGGAKASSAAAKKKRATTTTTTTTSRARSGGGVVSPPSDEAPMFMTHRENDFNEKTWWMVDINPIGGEEETSRQGATALLKRCMRTYGWDELKTRKVLNAYRQFIFLKKEAKDWDATILSPSHLVDQMWHCHILDVVNYYHDMILLCGHVVGHDPDGALEFMSKQQRDKNTRDLLQQHFGSYDKEVWGESPTKNDTTDSEDDDLHFEGPNAIIILFKGQCGAEIFMKMKRTAKMRKAFSAYASTKGVRMEDIRFLLQGNNLLDDWDRNGDLYDETPESLELHNNDQIDCMLIQRGC